MAVAGEKASAEISVSGRVQGVGYRFFAERAAAELGINGWARNMPDGSVGLEAEGDKEAVQRFVKELEKGPRMARVSEVKVIWKPYQGKYNNFLIKF